jgi:hypothetical protein
VLTDSPLAADPRTTIAITPVNGNDDPKSHTALFIAPFDGVKYYGFYPAGNNGPGGSNGTQYGFGPSDNLGGMQTVLEGAGFSANSVHTIKNSDVTVEAVAKAFTSGPAPGFIYFSTHGSKTGMIATGQFLGLGHDGIAAALNKVYAQLRTDGYGDLLDYGVDPGDKTPITLGQICVTPAIGGRPTGGSACYVGLTSAFFDWLRLKRGVDFSSSLVMMAACRTDETSVLRSAFLSRAYFSYNVSVQGTFAGAVFQNFVRSLVRHTHTAEEAYYNVLRVVNARQIIYPEDSVFKGISAIDDTGKYSIQEAFQGYFAETGTMLNYQDTGWLDTKDANPGSIWLLLYAGRGGGNAQQGSNNFSTCWKGPWGMGSTGTLGTWCYQSAPGYAPHPPEVAYANFLLTGSDQGNGLPVVGKTVARWTLNDSK